MFFFGRGGLETIPGLLELEGPEALPAGFALADAEVEPAAVPRMGKGMRPVKAEKNTALKPTIPRKTRIGVLLEL